MTGPQSIGARINTVEDAQKIIDVFTSRGYRQIDTSRIYGGGTSEEVRAWFLRDLHRFSLILSQIIGQLDLKGCTVDTKCVFHYNSFERSSYSPCVGSTRLRPGTLRRTEFGSRLEFLRKRWGKRKSKHSICTCLTGASRFKIRFVPSMNCMRKATCEF